MQTKGEHVSLSNDVRETHLFHRTPQLLLDKTSTCPLDGGCEKTKQGDGGTDATLTIDKGSNTQIQCMKSLVDSPCAGTLASQLPIYTVSAQLAPPLLLQDNASPVMTTC